MSLKALPIPPVPEETARVTRVVFPRGNVLMQVRDTLGAIYTDEAFADLFGFVQEGILRQVVRLGDRYVDVVFYGLLVDEWPTRAELPQESNSALHDFPLLETVTEGKRVAASRRVRKNDFTCTHCMCSRKENKPMSPSQERQPTLISIAPRFLVEDMEQALAFYGQLGFATPYHDEGFAIIERDGIALQFNVSDPTQEPPKEGCRVCYIGVTNIEALYQQYVPTGAIQSPIQATSWGTKGFWLCDPFRNILIFEESIPEEESRTAREELEP